MKNKSFSNFSLSKIVSITILTVFVIFLAVGLDQRLETTEYTFQSAALPKAFDGYRIVQISDLHAASFGKNNERLLKAVREAEPDIIVMTGDMIDKSMTVIPMESLHLFEELPKIALTYAVEGNHEAASILKTRLNEIYAEVGISEITRKQVKIEKDGEAVLLSGFSSYSEGYFKDEKADPNYKNMFNIALIHVMSQFDFVQDYKLNLVLSGHAHGGVIRLPFVGGLVSNEGKWFPKYTKGFYSTDKSTMLVNRGLGYTRSIPRFYNRPEVVVLTLKSVLD